MALRGAPLALAETVSLLGGLGVERCLAGWHSRTAGLAAAALAGLAVQSALQPLPLLVLRQH